MTRPLVLNRSVMLLLLLLLLLLVMMMIMMIMPRTVVVGNSVFQNYDDMTWQGKSLAAMTVRHDTTTIHTRQLLLRVVFAPVLYSRQ